jgi:antitoxin component HigA of HigAB toxin-antitoxin module
MAIEAIRSEADYEAALRRIETLWGASAGTSDGDELDVLVTLTEAYEREHYRVEGMASRRLATLGGTMPKLKSVPRSRAR